MLTLTKYLVSTSLLLSLASKLLALTFNTVGCGEVKGCFASPASCSTSENCDFLITYNATNSSNIEFELSGAGDWIAVGFSNDKFMANTDILMCVSNSSQNGHYYATGQTTPPRTNSTPSAIKISDHADENGVIKCRISRDINPNPAITNFFDLNQEVFLLAAVGAIQGSTLQQHSKTGASPNKVTLTQANSTVTMEASTTSSAPSQQGSYKFPDSCQTSADCNFLVTYQPSGNDHVVFEISGKGNWAGVGFSNDKLMPDTDMLICVSDRSQSGHYFATGRSAPAMTTPTPSVSAVEIMEHSSDGGVVKCKILREKNPGIDNFRDLNEEWFLLGAIGPLNDEGNSIRIHTERQASSDRIDVRKAGEASGGNVIRTKVLVHGWIFLGLMVLLRM